MSDCTVDLVLARLKVATPQDPLALFTGTKPGCIDVVFANTVETQRRIAASDPRLLGVYDQANQPTRQQVRAWAFPRAEPAPAQLALAV